jgi:hypothetical protein
MPQKRNDSDPLEARRRQLAEQQRLLTEQMSRLTEELHQAGNPAPAMAKPAEPPVWRMEEDARAQRAAEPTAARKRNLARQRRRDMFLFFLFIGLLLIIVIVIWVAYLHNTAPVTGI